MPDAAPDDFTPDTHAAADTDFTPDKGTDLPGSVFDKPTITQRLSRVGKAVTPAAVGTALPIAAGYGLATVAGQPEEGGALTSGLRIAGNTVGGALAPYAEWASQKLMGENPAAPSSTDVIKSAVMNGAFTALGEGGAAATKAAQGADVEQVRGALSSTPSSQRTVANVRKIRQGIRDQATSQAAETAKVGEQDLRNRDFWKQQGLNDQQIDSVMQSPDLQHQLASNIEAGNRYKQAYQATLDHTRQTFKARYNKVFEGNTATVDTVPLGQAMESAAQGGGEHELTPAWRSFLQRKGLALSQAGESGGPSVGGVPWKQLPEKLKAQIKAQGGSQGVATPTSELSLQDAKALRTELRENLPSNATNLDRKVYNQLSDQIKSAYEAHLAPEQKASLDAIDSDYDRFQNVLQNMDPRSEKYGQQVANALFDPAVKGSKDSEMALNFIRLAQNADDAYGAADQARTIMPNLREAFMNKALQAARVPGKPMDELSALRKLQDQWGGDKNARAVMGAMFGKDSPLADPATFSKVVEAAGNPEKTIKLTAAGTPHNILNSAYFQGLIAFGIGAQMMGVKPHGLFQAIYGSQGPGQQALAVASLIAGPWMIGKVLKSGNNPLQKAMVGYLTNPNSATAVRYASQLTGGLAGVMSQDSGTPSMPSPADVATSATGMAPTP